MAWDFSGSLAIRLISLLTAIILVRYIEPSGFGLVALAIVFVEISQVFTDSGLGVALIQRRNVEDVHYSSVFYFNLSIGVILTLLTILLAPYLADFFDNPSLQPVVQILSILFIVNALSSLHLTRLRKDLNYALLTKINIFVVFASASIGIALALLGFGYWSLVAQHLSRSIILCALTWFTAGWFPKFEFSGGALKQLWGFGFRIFLGGIFDQVFQRLDVIVIGKLYEPITLGFFDRAKVLRKMVVDQTSGSLKAVLFPLLSTIQNDLPRMRSVVLKFYSIICFLVFLIIGGLYLVSDEIILLMFTEKWIVTAGYFKIFLLSGFGYPISALLVNVLASRGRSKKFLKVEICKNILIGINLYSGFHWGIEGYLYGLVIVTILSLSINIYFTSREIEVSFYKMNRILVAQAVLAFLAGIAVYNLMHFVEVNIIFSVFFKLFLFLLIYIALNIMFKTVSFFHTKEETNQLIDNFRK